jgi:uncharacterized protein (DUF1778 family)
MPTLNKKLPNRERPDSVRVMVAEDERNELQKAANAAGMALSVFIRVTALEAARRRETKAA